MLGILDEADSLNRSYVPITADSQLIEAVRFFDCHGTQDEHLRARYLLGCAYRDLGQAPEALQTWQEAIERVDTFHCDSCHYALLCRIYSQMADVLYHQDLLDDYLESLDKSVTYAYKAKDTLAAANSLMYRMTAFSKLGLSDSVVAICDSSYQLLKRLGHEEIAAQNALMALPDYLKVGKNEEAAFYLDAYEHKSFFIDSLGNIEQGREIFYYLKGLYLLSVNKFDSAEIYFRRTFYERKDFEGRNGGAYGLALLYQKRHLPDSVAKYAMYSYVMNDSSHLQKVSSSLGRIKNMYNYSTHQRRALQEKDRADKEGVRFRVMLCFVTIISLLLMVIMRRWLSRKRKAEKRYLSAMKQLNEAQNELFRLRSHDEELSNLIAEKELAVEKLMREIEVHSAKQKKVGSILKDSVVYKNLHKSVLSGRQLSEEDWDNLNRLVIEHLPVFHQFISDKSYALTIKEYRTCVLLRLNISPMSISHLLGVAPSYVTKMGRTIMRKFFASEGTAKELAVKLNEMF